MLGPYTLPPAGPLANGEDHDDYVIIAPISCVKFRKRHTNLTVEKHTSSSVSVINSKGRAKTILMFWCLPDVEHWLNLLLPEVVYTPPFITRL